MEPKAPNAAAPNASQNRRLLNLIIDNVFLVVLFNVIGFVIGVMYGIASGGRVTQEQLAGLQGMVFALNMLISFLYFSLLEALCQKTVAKFLTGTKVVNMDGSKPSIGQCLGRAAARFIPFEPFSFLGSQEPRGWHDSLSGTRVIRDN